MGKQKSLQSVREASDSRTPNLCSWLTEDRDGVIVNIHARPGAKKDAVCGLFDGKLKVALAAPPVDGKANAKLCAFLAKELGTAKSAASLVTGETSREKRIRIKGVSFEHAFAKLQPMET